MHWNGAQSGTKDALESVLDADRNDNVFGTVRARPELFTLLQCQWSSGYLQLVTFASHI